MRCKHEPAQECVAQVRLHLAYIQNAIDQSWYSFACTQDLIALPQSVAECVQYEKAYMPHRTEYAQDVHV